MWKLTFLHRLLFGVHRIRRIRDRYPDLAWQPRALAPVAVLVPCRARNTSRSR